jgi:acetylornithine/N-succinyldiaminopimelate aminotransferase
LRAGGRPRATLARIRERGVLLSLAGADVLRFTPPLCVTRSEIDEGLEIVRAVLEQPPREG